MVVGVAEDGQIARSGTSAITALAGYVVPEHGAAVDVDVVRAYLALRLPGYMVPGSLLVVEVLPLTPTGKLDTAALPAPVLAAIGEFVEPATDAEVAVAQVFAEVLGIEQVGATDSFFDLGGNSLRPRGWPPASAMRCRPTSRSATSSTDRPCATWSPTAAARARRAALSRQERPERIRCRRCSGACGSSTSTTRRRLPTTSRYRSVCAARSTSRVCTPRSVTS